MSLVLIDNVRRYKPNKLVNLCTASAANLVYNFGDNMLFSSNEAFAFIVFAIPYDYKITRIVLKEDDYPNIDPVFTYDVLFYKNSALMDTLTFEGISGTKSVMLEDLSLEFAEDDILSLTIVKTFNEPGDEEVEIVIYGEIII